MPQPGQNHERNHRRTSRALVIGLGAIGRGCAWSLLREPDLDLVGIVDADPGKQGRSLSELSHQPEPTPEAGGPTPRAQTDLAGAIDQGRPDLALLTATSRFDRTAPLLQTLIEHKVAVVGCCEQMIWPWYRHAELAESIDRRAQDAGVTLLGTGVNPGLVMDSLPLVLAGAVRRVASVRCFRQADLTYRRQPMRHKIGTMLTPEQFMQLARAGKIGHTGLAESLCLLAAGLGASVEPGTVAETIEPILAQSCLRLPSGDLEPGMVAGLRTTARWESGGLRLELDLRLRLGESEPMDKIVLEGPQRVVLKIPGGLHGDSATIAMLINQGRRIGGLPPGLRTMLEAPPAGCLGGEDEPTSG